MSDLHDRVAKALGWSARDVRAVSMQSLRDLVRPVDPDLAQELSYAIQSGAYVRGEPSTKRHHARKTTTNKPPQLTCSNCEGGLVLDDPSYRHHATGRRS